MEMPSMEVPTAADDNGISTLFPPSREYTPAEPERLVGGSSLHGSMDDVDVVDVVDKYGSLRSVHVVHVVHVVHAPPLPAFRYSVRMQAMKRSPLLLALSLSLCGSVIAGEQQHFDYIYRDDGDRDGGLRIFLTKPDGQRIELSEKTPFRPLAAKLGPQPWLIILCRFSDEPGTPHPTEYYERLLGSEAPGLDHYWREVSFDLINLTGSRAVGWYNLPHPRSYYVHDGGFDNYRALVDAAAAADHDVYFPNFVGISLVFNALLGDRDRDLATAFGGQVYHTLDGVYRSWGITWIPAGIGTWVFHREVKNVHNVFAHEMGHALGLPHSTGPYGFNYDNFWDVMSYWGAAVTDPDFGILGTHTIAYHKDMLGWLPSQARQTVAPGSQVTIRMERTALPSKPNLLMAKVPVAGSATRYYTLEYRQRVGYDRGLWDDGVIIHDIDTGRYEVNINWGMNEWHPAHVVDADNNGNTGDDGAVWKTDEIFTDRKNGIRFRVEDTDESSARVTVNNNALFLSHFAHGSDVASSVVLLNPAPQSQVSGTVRLRRADGQSWKVSLDGQSRDGSFDFTVQPLGAGFHSTTAGAEAATGWLQVGSERPLTASVLFSSPHGVAAVPASQLSARSVLVPVIQEPARGWRSGVAVSNPNVEVLDVSVRLRSESGGLVPGFAASLQVPPWGQRVQFLDELLSGLTGQALAGTLDLSADLPFDAISILTSPEAYATLPVTPQSLTEPVGLSGEVTTFAGSPLLPGSADGPVANALFSSPQDAVTDKEGDVYIADSGNHTIRKIEVTTGTVSTFAGLQGETGATDGPSGMARFNTPRALCFDSQGNLWVADSQNHTIRRIGTDGLVSTVAGTAGAWGWADGKGAEARFDDPSGIAASAAGIVYISDRDNHVIRKLTPDGTVTTLAGTPRKAGSANGTGQQARFRQPQKIALDHQGDILVADSQNALVRKVAPDGQVSNFAGKAGIPGYKDGPADVALLNLPSGIAVDPSGIVYVADGYVIRRIATDGRVTSMAGYPHVPTSPDSPCGISNGTGKDARFCYLSSIQPGPSGGFLIADTNNHTIRKMGLLGSLYLLFFPQFATGETVASTLVVMNPSRSEAAWGKVRLLDSTGSPMEVGFNGGTPAPDFTFDIPPLGVQFFRSNETGELRVGSANLYSNVQLSATVLFSGAAGLAGVAAAPVAWRLLAPVESNPSAGLSTGLALFNWNLAPTQVTLRLRDTSGNVVASKVIEIPALGQVARFPEELFKDQFSFSQPFQGTLEAQADAQICGVGLRVVPGEIATLPVTVTE